jgi:iron complex outermembrane recepter protein
MNELTNVRNNGRDFRRQLLTSASALTMLATVYGSSQSKAADQDADRPTVWIELGAQLDQVNGFGEPFSPPFTSEIVADGFTSPLELQHALSQSFGGEGKISFQPKNSDWLFSASIRYGRANGGAKTHEQAPGCPCKVHLGPHTYNVSLPLNTEFSETRVSNNETHAILDFQAGKDIGLGLFGTTGESVIGFGVRFVQFTSNQIAGINAVPDIFFPSYVPNITSFVIHHHTYAVTSHVERSFRGLGPSLSWNASAPLLGNPQGGEIALDWGANAAVLFGQQKMSGHHQTVAGYYKTSFVTGRSNSHFMRSANPARTNSVIVPNAGGFAGLSYRFTNAKLSLGYRGDFFFGAMDGGIDAAHKETRGFYGPFASVSVGLGG